MLNSFFSAKLFPNNIVKVEIFSEIEKDENEPIYLIVNEEKYIKLDIVKSSFLNGIVIYECKSKFDITLGNKYFIMIKDFGSVPLNVNSATEFSDFDEKYTYYGNDLGANYTKEATTFKIWAPLACSVCLLIKKTKGDKQSVLQMVRGEKGVYSLTLNGDYDSYLYRYVINNSGVTFITTDPYGKGSSANGEESAVIDFSKVKIDLHNDKLPFLKQNIDAVVYELDVRDFTVDQHTNIENKGKYLGLVEEGKTTLNGNPAGLDYLKMLGITHVQLLPIYDFKTIDELNAKNSYNRGYDPQQYFVPEGSYSLDPNDPYSRIIEVKKMVAKLHECGIKVNMDVVFNHVYDYMNNVFEKVVPNYYFRKLKNGKISNDSFCGDDLDTKRPMVRKMILDSIKYWMEEYGIDGFRFDLMGLIDIPTMKHVEAIVKSIKKDGMVYGEGWDMGQALPSNERSSYLNAFKIPGIAFFNDSFRDIVKGPNMSSTMGYLAGNSSYLEGFKYVFLGSVVDYCFNKKYIDVNQSLNYCECHDNATLFDCLNNNIKDKDTCLRIIKTINLTILLSYGVSFIHAGQEIGLTKFGVDNTYNLGDKYNKFDYSVLDERYDMALYLATIIKFKKSSLRKTNLTSEEIGNNVYFINLDNGGLMIKLKKFGENYKDLIILYNPTNSKINVDLNDYYHVLISYAGKIDDRNFIVKNVPMNPFEVNVFLKKED